MPEICSIDSLFLKDCILLQDDGIWKIFHQIQNEKSWYQFAVSKLLDSHGILTQHPFLEDRWNEACHYAFKSQDNFGGPWVTFLETRNPSHSIGAQKLEEFGEE